MIKKLIFNNLKKRKERFPTLLSIELSSVCNAACIMCPHSECYKKVIECMRIIRKKLPKVKLYLSNNAGLLWKDRSQIIIDEKLFDVINFDIDGLTKETFENIRLKLKFDEVMENVLYFLDYKKRQKYAKPQTRVTIIKMGPTENEIEEFKKFWTPLVDKVDVNVYNTWLSTQEDRNVGEVKIQSQEGQFDWKTLIVKGIKKTKKMLS